MGEGRKDDERLRKKVMAYITVLGAGSWGTVLASLLAEKGYDVTIWAFEEGLADEIMSAGTNSLYLPGVKLPKGLKATGSIVHAVVKARFILTVVPSQFTRQVMSQAAEYIPSDTVIISASKGIEQNTLMTVSDIIWEITGREAAVLSGPSFAREVAQKRPTAVTLATRSHDIGLILQEIFNTQYFRVYTNHDVVGVELGGALKNVIAIASGICDGMGLGFNARAALITRGLAEIMRLGEALGADRKTFTGLSGLGDLVLTCTGPLSRNYTVGEKLGRGMKLSEILASTKAVAEGVATALSAYQLSVKHGVEMPIVEQVYEVIYNEKEPAEAVEYLMTRTLKAEF